MAIKIKQSHEKEIVALNTFEAVRLRPTMYLGQIAPMDDKIPIIKDGKLIQVEKTWSPGFMHLIVEILENAIDEAKRMKGKMKDVFIEINTKTNEVKIRDTGGGFHKAANKHKKTGKSVVRTAFEELHAGSNFADSSTNILGTHGVGSSIVNILSSRFNVKTINNTHIVECSWKDFVLEKELKTKKPAGTKTGTIVSFIPSNEVFPNFKWDVELIQTYLSFKQFLLTNDPIISSLKLNVEVDGKPLKLIKDFLPKNHIRIDNKQLGTIILWEAYENSTSVSFINGSLSSGIHQKIINDWGNDFLEYNLAHHFYDTLVSLNVPSHLMKFADQNKTKFATSRWEIEPIIEPNFKVKLLRKLKGSDIAENIIRSIEERTFNDNIKKIKKVQRMSKRKISDKYSPASKKKHILYITEGLSAAGSVRQARDSSYEGVYALKGKIKNAKRLSDLTENKEIMEIMSVLAINPADSHTPSYDKIVIATDEDCDGHHIATLLVNLFYKWFPHLIENDHLYKLVTPLVVCKTGKENHYFQTIGEFNAYTKITKVTNVNYLKGLGSLDLKDWKHVMKNKTFFKIVNDRSSQKFLDIAFGSSSDKRKKWLSGARYIF